MEQRVRQLEELLRRQQDEISALKAALAGPHDGADPAATAVAAHPKPAPQAQPTPQGPLPGPASDVKITASVKDGFSVRSADENFFLKIGGYLQTDLRYQPSGSESKSEAFIRRMRVPSISGTLFKKWDFSTQFDFGRAVVPALQEAYINYNALKALQIRAGRIKVPYGIEQQTSARYTDAIERSLAFSLSPDREVGLMIHGKLWDETAQYGFGVFNGTSTALGGGASGDRDINANHDKELVARIWAQPWRNSDCLWTKGIGLGIAGSWEIANDSNLGGYTLTTAAGTPWCTFTNIGGVNVRNDGPRTRLSPQAVWLIGPVGLKAEYAWTRAELISTAAGSVADHYDFHAGYVSAAWMITGEDAVLAKRVPRHPLGDGEGGWGALEAIGQISHVGVDDEFLNDGLGAGINAAFGGTAAIPAALRSTDGATAFTAGLNWYPVENLAIKLNYVHTELDDVIQLNAADPRLFDNEDVLLMRFQIEF